MTSLYEIPLMTLDGQPASLAEHKGEVMLAVNVASKCGFTPQYAGLEKLQETYAARGFTVLGFPCNQFGHQEKGSGDEIAEFCSLTYGVTFPMFEKLNVNGRDMHPLYKELKAQAKGGFVRWNFEKFLIGRDGTVIKRWRSTATPEKIAADIEAALGTA
jgi:glutathione peroxidase